MQSSAHASAHSMRFAEFARIRNSRKMFIYLHADVATVQSCCENSCQNYFGNYF